MVNAGGAGANEAMITLVIQDLRFDDKFIDIECDPTCTVEDLKCLLNIETQVNVEQQELYFRQVMLSRDTQKLNEIGIQHKDMINMAETQMSSADQDLMNAFFAAAGSSGKKARFT